MPKNIVFDSPYQQSAIAVGVGIEFERGVPQVVSDEAAAILLSNPHFKLVGDSAPEIPVKSIFPASNNDK